jgi:hypothetical protein
MALSNIFSSVFSILTFILKYLIGLTIIIILLPIAIPVFTPFVIFRYLVRKSAPYVRSDLGKMVSSVGSVMACANVYKYPETKLNISLVIEGIPNKEKARSDVKAAVEAMDPKTGIPYYPELKQNVTKWMGYPFWKNVKNFNLDEHFLWCDNEGTISHEELQKRLKEGSVVPFTENKALWRFAVYPNFLPNPEDPYYRKDAKYSVVIWEVNHCLADGFSIIKWLHRICGIKYTEFSETQKKNLFQRAMAVVCVLAKLPHDLADLLLNSSFEPKIWPNVQPQFSSNQKEHSNERNHICAHSTLVPFQKIREVRQKHGVKSVSITIAAFAAAVRTVLFEGWKEADIPESVNFAIALPLPGHPDKLRNHS